MCCRSYLWVRGAERGRLGLEELSQNTWAVFRRKAEKMLSPNSNRHMANLKGYHALPSPDDRSEPGVGPIYWRSLFCCPHEKSTCIWSNVQNQITLCAFSVGVCSATSTFFPAPHCDQTKQGIWASNSNTDTTATTCHHWLPSTGGSDSRVPGVTLQIQLMKDSDTNMLP